MWGINRKKGGSQMEHPPTVRTLQCGHAVWRIYARIYRLNAVPQKLAARACAVEMHLDIPEEPFYARIYRSNAAPQELAPRCVRACAIEMHFMTCQKNILCEKSLEKCRVPAVSTTFCASQRGRNTFGHRARAILCDNSHEKCRALRWSKTRAAEFVRLCSQNAHGHLTRAILFEYWQENATPPEVRPHVLC